MPCTEPVAIPGTFSKQEEVIGGCLSTSSVGPRAEHVLTLFLAEKRIYSTFREKPFTACQVRVTRASMG